jgi:quercetin dioxygenase-like cupin family protein
MSDGRGDHIGATVVPLGEGDCGPARLWCGIQAIHSEQRGRGAIVEHRFQVGSITAPHRHTREDEHSIVLAGEIGFRFDDSEVVLAPGGYITKPRGQMHAMWNAGSVPGRIIEVITRVGSRTISGSWVNCSFAHANDPAGMPHELPEFGELANQYGADLRDPGLAGRGRASIRAAVAHALRP